MFWFSRNPGERAGDAPSDWKLLREERDMKYGTLQGVLGEPLDTVFETAARLGFDGVELDWSAREDAGGEGRFAPSQRAALKDRAAQAGVEIPSIAAHFLNRGGLGSSDPALQQQGLMAVRAGIELCAALKARVLLVPFFGQAELQGGDDVRRLVGHLKALAPEAQARGVRLGVESTLPGPQVAALLDEVGSPFVGSYWDMGNAMWLGYDDLEEIETLGSRIVAVHAKEFAGPPRTAPGSPNGLNAKPLGEGEVPLQRVIEALRRTEYEERHGYLTLETGAFGDRLGSAAKALEVLRRESGVST
jgi:hexulose-6-phosphate isomerase